VTLVNRSIKFKLQPSLPLAKHMYFIYKTSRTWDVSSKAESDIDWVCKHDLRRIFYL